MSESIPILSLSICQFHWKTKFNFWFQNKWKIDFWPKVWSKTIMKFLCIVAQMSLYNPGYCLIDSQFILYSINLDLIIGSNECKQKYNLIGFWFGTKYKTRFCFYYIKEEIICFPSIGSASMRQLFIDFFLRRQCFLNT